MPWNWPRHTKNTAAGRRGGGRKAARRTLQKSRGGTALPGAAPARRARQDRARHARGQDVPEAPQEEIRGKVRQASAPASRQAAACASWPAIACRMPESTVKRGGSQKKIPPRRRAGNAATRRSGHAGCAVPAPTRPLRMPPRRRGRICPGARAPPSALPAFCARRQDARRAGSLGLSAFSLVSQTCERRIRRKATCAPAPPDRQYHGRAAFFADKNILLFRKAGLPHLKIFQMPGLAWRLRSRVRQAPRGAA